MLLVEDDDVFARVTTLALERAGLRCTHAQSAERGLELLRSEPGGTFDLVLLDVHLPGRPGWELLHRMREAGSETPVIFLSSSGAVEDRVRGLRLGADDYLVKPIEYEELLARIEAVLRRRLSLAAVEFGDVHVDQARRRVTRAGHPVALSPREYDLLMALVRANGTVVSRAALLREVWDIDFDPETNVLDVHLGRLRRKIDRHGRPFIRTVQGEGYCAVRHVAQQP